MAPLIHHPFPPTLSLLGWFNNSSFFSLPSNHLFLSFSSSFLINCLLLDVNHKNPPPPPLLFLFKLRSLVNHPFLFLSSLRSSHQPFPSNHTNHFPYSFQLSSSFLNRLFLKRINHPFFFPLINEVWLTAYFSSVHINYPYSFFQSWSLVFFFFFFDPISLF